MKLHPRERKVAEARNKIASAVLDTIKAYNLTYGETTQILASELLAWTKYQIRDERHPDDPAKPGGLA